MAEYHVPDVREFKEGVRREFSFLITDFGYSEKSSPFKYENPYSVFYQKGNVFIYIEGISYGFSLGVDIGLLSFFRNVKERFSLGYVVNLRKPELLEPRYPEKRGQLESMKRAAMELRECADDFIQGNFDDLAVIKEHIEKLNEQGQAQAEKAELKRIGIQASEAFHSGNYKKVIELLKPLGANTSKAQGLMLSQAEKKFRNANAK